MTGDLQRAFNELRQVREDKRWCMKNGCIAVVEFIKRERELLEEIRRLSTDD